MKNWLKKITGLDEIERAAAEAARRREKEENEILKLKEERMLVEIAVQNSREKEKLSQMSPKERATAKNEPWINVLDVKVNQNDIRNGFFELDWNRQFIEELIQAGYGLEADPEEEIVDRWFRDIVYNMFEQEGIDTSRGAGFINVVPLSKGKSEVS